MNNTEIKISQYADDTTLILNGNQESLSSALNTIENFVMCPASDLMITKLKPCGLGQW